VLRQKKKEKKKKKITNERKRKNAAFLADPAKGFGTFASQRKAAKTFPFFFFFFFFSTKAVKKSTFCV
jgi:hypothetical protein|tara:strand:- start:25 stop:228 length:204 start_codon:yes stop_codon:yes gene_type:complete